MLTKRERHQGCASHIPGDIQRRPHVRTRGEGVSTSQGGRTQGKPILLTPPSQPSGLLKRETINACCAGLGP